MKDLRTLTIDIKDSIRNFQEPNHLKEISPYILISFIFVFFVLFIVKPGFFYSLIIIVIFCTCSIIVYLVMLKEMFHRHGMRLPPNLRCLVQEISTYVKEQDVSHNEVVDWMCSSVAIYIDIERQFKTTEQLKSYVKSFLSTDVAQLSEKIIVSCLRMVKLNEIIEAYGRLDKSSTEQRRQRYKEDKVLYSRYTGTVTKSIQELDDLRIQLARYEFRLGETEVDSVISDLRLNLNSIDQGLDDTIKFSQEIDDIVSRL